MRIHVVVLATAVLCVSACAADVKVDKPRDEMTQREKDSVLAASNLPGSGVVKKAISMSDQQQKQQAALDSAGKEN